MGTSINKGQQTRTIVYGQALSSKLENQSFHELVPTGIYKGFNLENPVGDQVKVTAGIIFISDTTPGREISIRVQTVVDYTLADDPTPTNNVIVGRYVWTDSPNNFMDILAVSNATVRDDDIILGVVGGTFNEGTNLTFDYTNRDTAWLKFFNSKNDIISIDAHIEIAKTLILGDNLSVVGNISATGNVSADVDIIAGNDLEAGNDLLVGNDAEIGNDLNVIRDAEIGNNLVVKNHDFFDMIFYLW